MAKQLEKDNIDIVLYHGSCPDGFGAAFSVWYYYKKTFGLGRANKIEYIPCYHSIDMPSNDFFQRITDKNIVVTDFSYKIDILTKIIDCSKSFMIHDHHKTAQENLQTIPDHLKIFDMNRSGAVITWNYFFPEMSVPKFLAYIQDRDLWTNEYPDLLEFVAYFYELDYNFDLWETYLDEQNVSLAIEHGVQWLNYKDIIVNKAAARGTCILQKINNQYAIVVYNNSADFKSDIGNKSFHKFPLADFSVVFSYYMQTNETTFSLRSTKGRYDVSEIAKDHGGGGHRNASGLSMSGIHGYLQYPTINDHGLLKVLKYGSYGTVSLNTHDYDYVLYDVRELKEEWLMEDYLHLIKRKNTNRSLIVFKTISSDITYDHETNKVIVLYDYTIIHNELYEHLDVEKKLQHNMCTKDYHFVITSQKDLCDIFRKI